MVRTALTRPSNGFSDPFTVVVYNGNKKESQTTEIIYKTLNPVWAAKEFTFRVVSALTDTLKFCVWDFDKIGLNDFEGQVTVPIAAAAAKPNEPLDSWIPLVDKKVQPNCSLLLCSGVLRRARRTSPGESCT